MIRAIIFDFYGVLAVRGSTSFRKTHFPDDVLKMKQAGELQDQLGLGNIGYDDFIDGLAKLGGVDREIVLQYTENYQPNEQLLTFIRTKLKPRYKIGIISNAGANWVSDILGEEIKLFDDTILSYKAGVIKPDPKIYKMSAQNLDVSVSECVFIDDILTYCKGAEAAGMKSIWYKDFDQMKADLEKILVADPNN